LLPLRNEFSVAFPVKAASPASSISLPCRVFRHEAVTGRREWLSRLSQAAPVVVRFRRSGIWASGGWPIKAPPSAVVGPFSRFSEIFDVFRGGHRPVGESGERCGPQAALRGEWLSSHASQVRLEVPRGLTEIVISGMARCYQRLLMQMRVSCKYCEMHRRHAVRVSSVLAVWTKKSGLRFRGGFGPGGRK
jgi:hypothetical protein